MYKIYSIQFLDCSVALKLCLLADYQDQVEDSGIVDG